MSEFPMGNEQTEVVVPEDASAAAKRRAELRKQGFVESELTASQPLPTSPDSATGSTINEKGEIVRALADGETEEAQVQEAPTEIPTPAAAEPEDPELARSRRALWDSL